MKSYLFSFLAAAALALPLQSQAQSLIVSQDFEEAEFPPSGWSCIDNDGDGKTWQAQSGAQYVTQYSGSKCMAISYSRNPATFSSYSPQDNWIISPAFEVKNGQFIAQFVYAAQDLNNTEPLSLLVSEGGTETADFTEIWSTTVDNGYDDDIAWSMAKRSLAAYEGKTIRVAVRHKAANTYGLSIDNFFIFDQTGPVQPTGFSAKAATDGTKEVTLAWTNPAKTAAGEALTNLSIIVYRDGVQITELTGRTPGEADTYVDTTEDGTHLYTIAAKNESGEGQKLAARSVYLGEDVAKAISELVALTLPDGSVKVSWTAPTRGANNGYFNPATICYKVYRDGQLIADNVEGCSYIDAGAATGNNVYTVAPVTGGGESAIEISATAFVCDNSKIDVQIAQTDVRDNALNRLAMDMYSSYSVNQSIYFPEDFGFLTGEISDIILKGYHGTSSPLTMTGRIYISATTESTLTNWAAVEETDKVFDGEFTVTQGASDVVFHLDTPYSYTGGNIVITWIKDGKPTGGYSDRFYSIPTDKEKRTFTTSTYDAVDISALPHSTYSDKSLSELPSTRFLMTPKGVASLEGTVTTGENKTPVANAIVSADGFDGLTATTNTEGYYYFKYIPASVTSITIAKVGYEDNSIAVSLTDGQTSTVDGTLTRYANFTLSGKVTTEDTGLNAVGATVTLGGYEALTTKVGDDGRWSIDGVYVGKDYTISVKYSLYDIYTGEFNYTENADQEYAPIVLDRALIPAWNLNATIDADGSKAELTWSEPTSRDVKAGVKSIGDVSTQKYTGGDYYSTVYNIAHAFSEEELAAQKMIGLVVAQERVFIKATKGTFTAKVWRGTRDSHVEVASQVIPADSISTDGKWITVTFDTPAEIKPGSPYMIGVEAAESSSSPFGEATGSSISGGNNIKWGDSSYSSNGYSPWCIQAICEVPGTDVEISDNPDAPKCAYNIYRGIKNADGIAEWEKLTTSPVSELAYTDNAWSVQVAGEYVYGVTAVYNKVGESGKALSEPISRAVNTDVAVTAFITPVKSIERQEKAVVTVKISNFGELPVENIPVALKLNGEDVLTATYNGTLNKGESAELEMGEVTLADGMNVLVATTNAEADQLAANDALTFELPNFENINLRGYRWDAYGNAGFMQFGSNNPEGAEYMVEVTPNDALITAGEMVNGTFYAFTATWWGESKEFVEIDPATWIVSRAVENTDNYVLDMAYDYANEVMYCLSTYSDGIYLGKVNLATGEVEAVGALSHIMRALACNLDGQLYSIDSNGNLYKLNSQNADETLVGDTGAGEVAFLQSMAFDHNTGRLFWARTKASISGELFELDPATASSTRLGTVLYLGYDPTEIVGLYTPYTVPAKSFAAVSVSPADGSYLKEFDGVTITYPHEVVADADKVANSTFSAAVAGWNYEGNGTNIVKVIPADENKNNVVVEFEPETSYTLVIPEGAFLKSNGDYSEAISITLISSVSGVENVSTENNGSVRYFNLQGLEVKNPADGNVYIIRKSDGTATKQIVR